ncbi:MAG: precorrin-6y C5,15-methyltransferase (decarboxylating) subunit CbiE [Deltaproteobacteria bacterium]|jgi:precorrin-6Y C5,15-methyltransferase (decarboxylating)|nr:precorrin-6y C5,15-methyltransferase (decarboxylating) subunit CbiE [Deltaproteobacteria bacterium]MBW2504262.1 precorrin-6y C5,15-methyltransferase (decarboxylating) subunit CbiE [Deltaproteobacteria bacterium]MBW2519078.1 precorrin-6y C5,15-methyltransferase (decarboxylating) subunit CbiE [Deltaproteobacteria bacterium]
MKTIHVIGAGVEGQEGFSGRALEIIDQAALMFGAERLLSLFPDFSGRRVEISDNLADMLRQIEQGQGPIVVLASGDPLFFGIGRYLLRNLPKETLEFVPNISSVQYAFAKIREPWDDAIFVSTEGRGLKGSVDQVVAHDKIAILTDETNTPKAIARELIKRGRDGYTAYLCENLGSADETITHCDLDQLLSMQAAALNVLILIKEYEAGGEGIGPGLGIPDEEFATIKKLITREEVRAVSLAKLRLRHDMVLWDIGAGSGSVSIEADHLLPNGKVFAIERNPQCLSYLKQNLKQFNSRNVTVVDEQAPACLEELPDPDRVFIGGSGGHLWAILDASDGRLPTGGRIVLNAATLDTLTAATEFFENAGYELEVTTVNVSRTRPLTDYKMFEAFNPVFVMVAVKQ